MISFFPAPYPDELLYSIISRYHIRSGNTSAKITLKELFNCATVTAVLDLPCCIDALVGNLPSFIQYSSEDLIIGHTLFPYYAAFLPDVRIETVISSMKSNFGGDIHTRTGIMASTIRAPQYIRFCPLCNEEDKCIYGEFYWHRQHQVPGVMVCYKHLVPLIDSTVEVHGMNKHIYVPADENNCKFRLIKVEPNKEYEHLKRLTHDVNWIFNNFTLIKDIKDFREKYLAILINIGLATSSGRVYQAELLQSFVNYYGNTLLKLLQSDIDYNNQDNWVSSIVRKHRKAFHPMRHLLMMRFLAGSAEKFFSLSAEYYPFGKGPWICLNAAANHNKEPVIKELDITHCMDTKLPVGTFKCSCGFIYSRRGPDTSNEDKYRIGRIKAFGTVWEGKLKKYVEDEKLSMRETARRLNVDPNTVKKYASALGLNCSWDSESCNSGVSKRNDCSSQTDTYESKKAQYRSLWIDTIKKNPGKSAAALRNAAEDVYMWLYKNDKIWLNTNTPKLDIRKNKANRVDWKERDNQLFKQVRKSVNEILHADSKPTRITVSRIGKVTGNLALLEKHLDKLPLTKRYLLDHIESIEAFQKRRVIWAANELNKSGEELKKWKIIRKAGIRSEYKEEIDGAIDEIVERYDKFQCSYWGEKH